MLRSFLRSIKTFLYILVAILLLFCLGFAVLQSDRAQKMMQQKAVDSLASVGIHAKIEDLKGTPPFLWTMEKATLTTQQGQLLELNTVKLRVAFFPLFKGQLAINYIAAERADLFISSEEESTGREMIRKTAHSFSLPFALIIHHFKISHLNVHSDTNYPSLQCAVQGKINILPHFKNALLSLNVASIENHQSILDFTLEASKSNDHFKAGLQTNVCAIPALFHGTLKGDVICEMDLSGKFSSVESLLNGQNAKIPLKGRLKAIGSELDCMHVPLFNRTWKLFTQFSIASSDCADIKKFILSSDALVIKGKGVLCTELENSQGLATFEVPDLNKFSPQLPYVIQGKIEGKGLYKDTALSLSFSTENVKVDEVAFNRIEAIVKGKIENAHLRGEVAFSSVDAQIPFKNGFAFDYEPHASIAISDFILQIPDATAKGHGALDLADYYFEGQLDASLNHIDRFGPFFHEEYLEGNLLVHVDAYAENEMQNATFSFVGNSIRYQEILVDQISISGDIIDLYNAPEGHFNVLAEKIYSPRVSIDSLLFGAQSDDTLWPFYLDVSGRLDNPFKLRAEGFSRNDTRGLSLELTDLYGIFASIPFKLRYPALFEWNSDSMNLTPFEFALGKGNLYTTFECSGIRSIGKWDLQHFPLEIVNAFSPSLQLNGYVSTSGFFDANPAHISGNMTAFVEEANFSHNENKEPFRVKGSFQAHLNDHLMQIQSNLQAIDAQFLNFHASLPFSYQLYPFKIALDTEKPASAELISEGKLEDLFEFVNLGTNHLSGLLSARLFLSNTLASPDLQGTIDLQHGTYENYFIGVTLRDIHASCEASHDTIRLLKLTAADENHGKLEAEGKIYIHPKEHFPYQFTAEQKDLHTLRLNMIDCHLTGPLYFTGNTKEATAQGNLIIDKAKIQLTEQLPYEPPTLPFTFIHRPPHLLSSTVISEPHFQFHIDLELTADNKVYVEGRGLNAELQGNVHVTGTNTQIKAEGDLKLIKGEYQFSGKIFKLTEGEIVFKDKPTPSAYLNLNGTLTLPATTVTAMLRGSLTHPQLSFQSNPQMSTSSILALILFNKDISAISQPEAIQLASVLMSLSGGAGPDVLETIRKTIGVDRLNIVSASPGSDEIAVQIGKYLTRGIMVTLSQSATSSQVIVEVELPKGFVFQAETQEEQEGKFSLKWTKSY